MQFRKIRLADRDLFNHYLAGRQQQLITYNFTNLFLWQDWDPYSWAIVEDTLCVKSDFYGWDAVLAPSALDPQALFQATDRLVEWYAERQMPFLMTEVPEDIRALIQKRWPGRFLATPYRDGFNYVYAQDDLANLPGQKYAAKRNHVRRFIRENPDYQFLPLTAEWLPSCRERQLEWTQSHDMQDDDLRYEHAGVLAALEHFSELNCLGACLVIDGRVEAFTIAEPLNETTMAVHIEKGDIALHGTYQALNRFFAEEYCADFRFINRAEDMGHPGQRKAKMSYHPHHLEKKYHLRLAR